MRDFAVRATPVQSVGLQVGGGPGAVGQTSRFAVVKGRGYELRSNVEIAWTTGSQPLTAANQRVYPTGHPAKFIADSNELVVAEVGTVPGGYAWLFVEAEEVRR
jgi:hypothetical protein